MSKSKSKNKEQLIFNGNNEATMEYIKKWYPPSRVGDTIRIEAGAPGIGYSYYRITKIDESGLYGILIDSTVRILDPSEVI